MIKLFASLGAAVVVAAAMEASWASECEVRVNQPAASVQLNRPVVPADLCLKDCQARLVGTHRESGQIVALAIYTGKHCR